VIDVLFFYIFTELGPPRAPKRLMPLMARRAATAIPIEEEFNSGWP
jgi:hypothetical protein